MASKQNSFEPKAARPAPKIHPIWRGIGFVMILLTPILAWAAAEVTTEVLKPSTDINIRALFAGLRGGISLPDWFSIIPGLTGFLHPFATYPDIKVKIVFFLVWLMLFSGVLSFLYAIIYRLVGPPRYGPQDVAAPRARVKRYTR
ncbi:MAG: hypothetical protein OHK0031_02620 [Anaerolineales bacterium]